MTPALRVFLRSVAEVFPGTRLQLPNGAWARMVLHTEPPPTGQVEGGGDTSAHAPTTSPRMEPTVAQVSPYFEE